jgi:hypothetical protein
VADVVAYLDHVRQTALMDATEIRVRRPTVQREHGIAHLKNWRSLARHLGRREILDDTVRAVAGLLSDHQHTDRPQRTPIAALTASAM